jgi:hypothetical protein
MMQVWKDTILGALLLTMLCASGCKQRTVVGGSINSPDGKFIASIHVLGAPGRAYTDETEKTVIIDIKRRDASESLLLHKKIIVHGSDIATDGKWYAGDNLRVNSFDYGPGVELDYGEAHGMPIRHINTVRFLFDSEKQTYREDASNNSSNGL